MTSAVNYLFEFTKPSLVVEAPRANRESLSQLSMVSGYGRATRDHGKGDCSCQLIATLPIRMLSPPLALRT